MKKSNESFPLSRRHIKTEIMRVYIAQLNALLRLESEGIEHCNGSSVVGQLFAAYFNANCNELRWFIVIALAFVQIWKKVATTNEIYGRMLFISILIFSCIRRVCMWFRVEYIKRSYRFHTQLTAAIETDETSVASLTHNDTYKIIFAHICAIYKCAVFEVL